MNKNITQKERLARIKINSFSYLRSDWYGRLMKIYGSAQNILCANAADISQNGGVKVETAEKFLKQANGFDAEKELDKVNKAGGYILVEEDSRYPQSLKEIGRPPVMLYVRGNIENAAPKIAVVGTRKPSRYGIKTATRLAGSISQCGVIVISGLARGIDTTAHTAAVDNERPTWAVLGNGLGRYYPAENKKLTDKIIDTGGAIITEFPFDAPPLPFHFPRRNRLIAGLSLLTVVVEGAQKSGALITAKLALEQGKDVLAVPGPLDCPTSEGPNLLIREGAGIITSALDIIEHIPLDYKSLVKTEILNDKDKTQDNVLNNANLSENEKMVLQCVASDVLSPDDIAMKLNWSIPKVSAVLFELEAKSILTASSGKYERKI
jgi:DNA processing protein